MVANLVIAINDDRMEAAASADNDDILVYMGWDTIVPRDVIRCRVHPSVTVFLKRHSMRVENWRRLS